MPNDSHRFCVAPMLDLTTPECRALHRLFTRRALLYTEMVTTGALIYGDAERHLQHHGDAPCALQLGGGEPEALARACAIALPYGYQEINLNVGCPSDRVQNNRIGACLMDDAALVAECVSAMQAAVGAVPVTVKHRLAIDEQDEREVFHFVETVASRGPCRVFIIHARKAWLQGLSPKANRDVPPLNYPLVYEVKRRFPELTVVINGGIGDLTQCQAHLQHVDGVMLGRAAYRIRNCCFSPIPSTARPRKRWMPCCRVSAPSSQNAWRAAKCFRITPATCSASSPACAAPKYTAAF